MPSYWVEDGNVPSDNNAVEGTNRSFCIGKRNWYFRNSQRDGLNPFEYLTY